MANTAQKPGLLARVFGRKKPATPARMEPKVQHQVRRFKAARPGRLVGGFGNLLATSSRQEVRQDLRGLISHARTAAQNVDYLKSYEMMVRRHVVGPGGIKLEMDVRNPDGTRDTTANKTIETAWTSWGKRGNCTPCGRLSWWDLEKVAATMLAREGNFLLREWRGPDFGPFAYQVQPLSIDLLDLDMVQSLANGAYIDGGVEFNQFGRPLAFHMFDGHPAESHTGRGRTRIRIPAEEIIQVVRHTETGQVLGVPESHTALRRFNMLSKYEESALTAAHYGASAMVFLEQEGDGTPPPAGGVSDAEEIPEEMEAGMVVELPPGYKANANPSNYPDANMPGFLKSLTRGGAAGLGVSHAGLSSDMEGANFSSLKDGRGEERDEWRMFQGDLSGGMHNEVFKSWLPLAMVTKQVDLPISKAAKFEAAKWRARGWASVNPKDDAVADDKNLENRLVAPSDIAASRGENFEDVAQRIARDIEVLEAARPGLGDALINPQKTPPPPADPGADGGSTDPDKG